MPTAEDKQIVLEIIHSKRELIHVVDTKDIDNLPKALRIVKALFSGVENFDTNGNASKLSLASTMLFLKKSPTLWRGKYETFDGLASDKIYGKGFQKAQAAKYMAVARKFGKFKLERIAAIPFENMYLISRHTDSEKPACEKFLEAAEKMDAKALLEWVAEKTGNTKESIRAGSFKVVGTVEQVKQLQGALKNPDVLAAIEEDPEKAKNLSSAEILLAFLGEFASTHGISI